MKKVKVIPAIDLMEGQVVRLLKGDPKNKTVYSSDPLDIAKKWEKEGADMLHVVDLDATLARGNNFEMIRSIAEGASVPVQVAGGLRSKNLIAESLGFSSRIVVGTVAFKDRALLLDSAETFGRDRIVISVDHVDGNVVTHGWQKTANIKLFDALRDFAESGFTEFLLTNVSKDGTLQGPDIENLQKACQMPKINVIASGGISGPDDIAKVKECGAYGVILGKALYDGKVSVQEAKRLA